MLPAQDKQQLVREHLSYVRALAAQIRERLPASIELEELVAYGTQGLIHAAERFNPHGGASFPTYAYYRIRGAIYDGLREMGWLSRNEYARHRIDERTSRYLADIADKEAALPNGKAESLESSLQAVSDTMAGVATIFVTSLESLSEAERQTIDPELGADGRLQDAQRSERVRSAVAALPEKERRLVELYYFGDKTLEEAGAVLGLSKSWASRLHTRAIELLKGKLEDA